jgi:hypothetical protein
MDDRIETRGRRVLENRREACRNEKEVAAANGRSLTGLKNGLAQGSEKT